MPEREMSVAEIMDALQGENPDFDLLVPAMLRAVARDEHADAVEEFIGAFEKWRDKEDWPE